MVGVGEAASSRHHEEHLNLRTTRFMIIEANRILREGLAAVISGQPDFRVVKTLSGDRDMVRAARQVKPDAILLDMGLRRMSALRAVTTLVSILPRARVIGMGLLPSQEDIVGFVQAGAAGFIVKNASVEDVLRTIRAVVDGEVAHPPSLTGSLLAFVADRASRKTGVVVPPGGRMTRREREIIMHVANGESDIGIARHLGISPSAVRSHISNIVEKMALRSHLHIEDRRRGHHRS